MTVMGIIMKPTDALAVAPLAKLAVADSCGSLEEEFVCTVSALFRANLCRIEFKVVKYRAEPILVRIHDGSVPRHSCRIGLG